MLFIGSLGELLITFHSERLLSLATSKISLYWPNHKYKYKYKEKGWKKSDRAKILLNKKVK